MHVGSVWATPATWLGHPADTVITTDFDILIGANLQTLIILPVAESSASTRRSFACIVSLNSLDLLKHMVQRFEETSPRSQHGITTPIYSNFIHYPSSWGKAGARF